MSNFEKDWQRKPTQGLSKNIYGLIKKTPPLKPQVENTIKGLNRPISKLDYTTNQLSQKEQKVFNKIVQAKQNGNTHAAKVFANELVQIRKTRSMIGNMKLSVDRTQLRLSTVNAIGDSIVSIKPAVFTMNAVVPVMNKIIPQASLELESMGTMLGDMMPGSISGDYSFVNSGMPSQETESILQEAASVAEIQIGDKFPSIPNNSINTRTSVDSFKD